MDGQPEEARRRPASAWLEPALALLVLGLVVGTMLGLPTPPHAWILNLSVCVGAALSGRFPRVAAAISAGALLALLSVPGQYLGPAALSFAINVFAAVRLQLTYWPWILGVVGSAAFVTQGLHSSRSAEELIASSTVLVVLAALAVGAGILWHKAEALIQLERERAERQLLDLRLELARELHDTVAQTLSHASMRAHMAAWEPDATDGMRDQLQEIADECGSAAQDLRQILSTLRSSDAGALPETHVVDADSLAAFLDRQLGRLTAGHLDGRLVFDIDTISAARAAVLGKIAVEAVNNMLKYAREGSTCLIELRSTPESVVAVFTNDTVVRPGRRPSGLGLVGVRERAALFRGTVDSTLKNGLWRLEVRLPHGFDARTTPSAPIS